MMRLPKKVSAAIQSLVINEDIENKEDIVRIVGVLEKNKRYLAWYKGNICEASYNQYSKTFFVYDVYHVYQKTEAA